MRQGAFIRIGHGGASALAPANTLASFDVARQVGVDVVEFDVRAWRGELILAHTIIDARRGGNVPLRQALAHLSGADFNGLEFHVDVKHEGCEPALVHGLREFGLMKRTVVCSQVSAVLDRVRTLEPRARVGISIGGRVARASQRWRNWRDQVLAGLRSRRWDVLMAQHRLIDRHLLEDVVACDGVVYAWTVNRPSAIAGLSALGVHGIATSDPRLFGASSGLVDGAEQSRVAADQGRAAATALMW
jgi:glycerophosphoryl diester phosphodiesterase